MEVLDKILAKVRKSPRSVTIKITDLNTKSCGNCNHLRLRRTSWDADSCMHYPNASLTDVNNKICTPIERKHWSPKQHGLISRFFKWLF